MFPLVDGIEFFVSEREKISFVRKWRLEAPLIRPDGGGVCMHAPMENHETNLMVGGGDSVRMGLSRSNLFRHL